jgi:hypothetical protein
MPQCDQCARCDHYRGLGECVAFPQGIPERIMTGGHDHREPYPGDGGVTWTPFVPDPTGDDGPGKE